MNDKMFPNQSLQTSPSPNQNNKSSIFSSFKSIKPKMFFSPTKIPRSKHNTHMPTFSLKNINIPNDAFQNNQKISTYAQKKYQLEIESILCSFKNITQYIQNIMSKASNDPIEQKLEIDDKIESWYRKFNCFLLQINLTNKELISSSTLTLLMNVLCSFCEIKMNKLNFYLLALTCLFINLKIYTGTCSVEELILSFHKFVDQEISISSNQIFKLEIAFVMNKHIKIYRKTILNDTFSILHAIFIKIEKKNKFLKAKSNENANISNLNDQYDGISLKTKKRLWTEELCFTKNKICDWITYFYFLIMSSLSSYMKYQNGMHFLLILKSINYFRSKEIQKDHLVDFKGFAKRDYEESCQDNDHKENTINYYSNQIKNNIIDLIYTEIEYATKTIFKSKKILNKIQTNINSLNNLEKTVYIKGHHKKFFLSFYPL